jgi:Xaa-Pro aminopeptidase
MFSVEVYKQRRKELSAGIGDGLILIAGNNATPRNYSGNSFPFRQDSNFLYFAGIDLPGLMLVIDVENGVSTLYGNDATVEESIWTGTQPKLVEWANKSGIEYIKPKSKLIADLKKPGIVHFLPPYTSERKLWLADIFGKTTREIEAIHSTDLIRAVVKQRSIKSTDEILQIEDALNRATTKFHVEAMKMALSGTKEYEIAGHIESTMLKNNCSSAYGIICSVRGEVLHNEHYNNSLKKGQLLLIDAGAENPMHYASDITRTTPVDGKFNEQQKSIYTIVYNALTKSIDSIQAGKLYSEIHLNASHIIASGLKEMGLMKGDTDEAVKLGAHAMFFPHGLGHMLGLDVHDMEDLGENFVGYSEAVGRSKQFGTSFLRLARKLEPGFVITVEPGIYFIPALIKKWKEEKIFKDFINYAEAEKYFNFGGIRIEDNIVVTEDGCRVLGNPIPKAISEIEGLF